MKKFLSFIAAVMFMVLNAAPAQNKIPATAVLGATINLEQILSWPLFQQFAEERLQSELAKARLTTQDIQGEMALGLTFAAKDPKENLRLDVAINLKHPNAGKLFSIAEKELSKNPGIVKKKEAGRPCIEDENIKIIQVSKNEITLQLLIGQQLKFIKLAPAKNIFKQFSSENATMSIVINNQNIAKIFASDIPEQARPFINGKLFSIAALNCQPDGSLKFKLTDTFKSSEDCKKSLEAFNTQMAALKENPAISAIADKIKAKANNTTLTVSGEFSAMELQMAAGSIMLLMMSQQQNTAVPAAN